MIAVVDAQTGNLRSVEKALRAVLDARGSAEAVVVTADPDVVRRAARVVVPGQGAFGDCGRALSSEAPLGRAILEVIEAGTPYLGICLGLQILFEESDEAPGTPGLGVLRGRVVRIPDGLPDGQGGRLKVPHMGWNEVVPRRQPHPLLAAEGPALHPATARPYYFVHSFHAQPSEPLVVEATAGYGDLHLTAAVAVRNVFAVQFHPEKSQQAGLALLSAFVGWTG
jgi:glutamine amidotransferase